MIPVTKNITIRRGDTKEIFFRVRTKVWNAVDLVWEPGPYKDLTGYTIASQVRATKESTTVLLAFTVTLGDQTEVTQGRGSVMLKAHGSVTATIPTTIAKGVWDVEFTEPDTDPFTYIEGDVTFTMDVTRA